MIREEAVLTLKPEALTRARPPPRYHHEIGDRLLRQGNDRSSHEAVLFFYLSENCGFDTISEQT